MIVPFIFLAALQVHEWGVLTYSPFSLTGAPYPVTSLVDKAPVLYFHGDPCTVTVRIDLPGSGSVSSVYPAPDEGGTDTNFILWNNIRLTASSEDQFPEGWSGMNTLNYPEYIWKQVEALDIIYRERQNRFLYYECLPSTRLELPFTGRLPDFSSIIPHGETPCIVLRPVDGRLMYGVFTLDEIAHDLPKGFQFLNEPAILRREFYQWADGTLDDDEFDAFWNTWESRFLSDSGSRTVVVYPLPDEVTNQIASIQVFTDGDSEISINRFIVAEVPY